MITFAEAMEQGMKEQDKWPAYFDEFKNDWMKNDQFTRFIARMAIHHITNLALDDKDIMTVTSADLHMAFAVGMLVGMKMEREEIKP